MWSLQVKQVHYINPPTISFLSCFMIQHKCFSKSFLKTRKKYYMYKLKILLMSFHDWQHDFNRVCIFKDLIWSDVQPDIWKKNTTTCICCMFMISLCDQVGDLDLSLHHEVDTPAKLKNRVSSKNWGVCITKAKKKALSNKRNDRCKLLMKAVGLSALWQADTHSYRGHSECDWWICGV